MICCFDIIAIVTGADLKKKKKKKVSCLFFIRQNRVVGLSLHAHKKERTASVMCDKVTEFEHPAHDVLIYTEFKPSWVLLLLEADVILKR